MATELEALRARLTRAEAFIARVAALDTETMETGHGPDAIEVVCELIDEAKAFQADEAGK